MAIRSVYLFVVVDVVHAFVVFALDFDRVWDY